MMGNAVKKTLVSVAINTAIFGIALAITEIQKLNTFEGLLWVTGLKLLQQVVARMTSDGGETPTKKL